MGVLEKIYSMLPEQGQNIAASAYGAYRRWLRFGPGYEDLYKGYVQRDFWDENALMAFQQDALKQLLINAANHVPYYRKSWTDDQKKSAFAGELAGLPLLNKDPIRLDPMAFCRDDMNPIGKSVFHTSGSSGTPVATVWTPREVRDSRALREARSANWAGTSFREARATFSGRIVVPDADSRGPFHRFNAVEKQVYFSAFHLSSENAAQYVEALRRHKTQWLTGYAVSYYLLARHILDQGVQVPKLKAIVTTSEKLTPEMRNVMQKAFGCPVFEEYSTVENAVFASECDHGSLHVSTDSGVLEILRPDGSPCGYDEPGEVVATSFVRQYQPFIRYRLGDVAMWSGKRCECGRSLPVLKEVVGRIEDVLISSDGREMVRFHGVFLGIPGIAEAQVIQETLQVIRIKVVISGQFNAADRVEIESRVRQRLGPVNVFIDEVESIPREKSGKFKAVVSLIKKSN